MNAPRLIRRAAAALLAGTASIALPSALEAACSSTILFHAPDPADDVVQITCCGETACCTVVWTGPRILEEFCRLG